MSNNVENVKKRVQMYNLKCGNLSFEDNITDDFRELIDDLNSFLDLDDCEDVIKDLRSKLKNFEEYIMKIGYTVKTIKYHGKIVVKVNERVIKDE